jgi:hypothetical protein
MRVSGAALLSPLACRIDSRFVRPLVMRLRKTRRPRPSLPHISFPLAFGRAKGWRTSATKGGTCRLNIDQQDKLKAWIAATLPRTTREVGAWIARECAIEYQTRSGLVALLHRLGMEDRKPKAISRKLDPAKQAAFHQELRIPDEPDRGGRSDGFRGCAG